MTYRYDHPERVLVPVVLEENFKDFEAKPNFSVEDVIQELGIEIINDDFKGTED